jgi:hypothetical protein
VADWATGAASTRPRTAATGPTRRNSLRVIEPCRDTGGSFPWTDELLLSDRRVVRATCPSDTAWRAGQRESERAPPAGELGRAGQTPAPPGRPCTYIRCLVNNRPARAPCQGFTHGRPNSRIRPGKGVDNAPAVTRFQGHPNCRQVQIHRVSCGPRLRGSPPSLRPKGVDRTHARNPRGSTAPTPVARTVFGVTGIHGRRILRCPAETVPRLVVRRSPDRSPDRSPARPPTVAPRGGQAEARRTSRGRDRPSRSVGLPPLRLSTTACASSRPVSS